MGKPFTSQNTLASEAYYLIGIAALLTTTVVLAASLNSANALGAPSSSDPTFEGMCSVGRVTSTLISGPGEHPAKLVAGWYGHQTKYDSCTMMNNQKQGRAILI